MSQTMFNNVGFTLQLVRQAGSKGFQHQLSFQNLLINPRGYFTQLFPTSTTWALLILLKSLHVLLFVAPDINNAIIRSLRSEIGLWAPYSNLTVQGRQAQLLSV